MPRRPIPAEIAAARAMLKALLEMPDYQPMNPAYSIANLMQIEATLTAAENADDQNQRAAVQSRSVRADTGRRLCQAMREAKAQVVAQYGDDSYAVQAIGLKRRSEYKRPRRRTAVA